MDLWKVIECRSPLLRKGKAESKSLKCSGLQCFLDFSNYPYILPSDDFFPLHLEEKAFKLKFSSKQKFLDKYFLRFGVEEDDIKQYCKQKNITTRSFILDLELDLRKLEKYKVKRDKLVKIFYSHKEKYSSPELVKKFPEYLKNYIRLCDECENRKVNIEIELLHTDIEDGIYELLPSKTLKPNNEPLPNNTSNPNNEPLSSKTLKMDGTQNKRKNISHENDENSLRKKRRIAFTSTNCSQKITKQHIKEVKNKPLSDKNLNENVIHNKRSFIHEDDETNEIKKKIAHNATNYYQKLTEQNVEVSPNTGSVEEIPDTDQNDLINDEVISRSFSDDQTDDVFTYETNDIDQEHSVNELQDDNLLDKDGSENECLEFTNNEFGKMKETRIAEDQNFEYRVLSCINKSGEKSPERNTDSLQKIIDVLEKVASVFSEISVSKNSAENATDDSSNVVKGEKTLTSITNSQADNFISNKDATNEKNSELEVNTSENIEKNLEKHKENNIEQKDIAVNRNNSDSVENCLEQVLEDFMKIDNENKNNCKRNEKVISNSEVQNSCDKNEKFSVISDKVNENEDSYKRNDDSDVNENEDSCKRNEDSDVNENEDICKRNEEKISNRELQNSGNKSEKFSMISDKINENKDRRKRNEDSRKRKEDNNKVDENKKSPKRNEDSDGNRNNFAQNLEDDINKNDCNIISNNKVNHFCDKSEKFSVINDKVNENKDGRKRNEDIDEVNENEDSRKRKEDNSKVDESKGSPKRNEDSDGNKNNFAQNLKVDINKKDFISNNKLKHFCDKSEIFSVINDKVNENKDSRKRNEDIDKVNENEDSHKRDEDNNKVNESEDSHKRKETSNKVNENKDSRKRNEESHKRDEDNDNVYENEDSRTRNEDSNRIKNNFEHNLEDDVNKVDCNLIAKNEFKNSHSVSEKFALHTNIKTSQINETKHKKHSPKETNNIPSNRNECDFMQICHEAESDTMVTENIEGKCKQLKYSIKNTPQNVELSREIRNVKENKDSGENKNSFEKNEEVKQRKQIIKESRPNVAVNTYENDSVKICNEFKSGSVDIDEIVGRSKQHESLNIIKSAQDDASQIAQIKTQNNFRSVTVNEDSSKQEENRDINKNSAEQNEEDGINKYSYELSVISSGKKPSFLFNKGSNEKYTTEDIKAFQNNSNKDEKHSQQKIESCSTVISYISESAESLHEKQLNKSKVTKSREENESQISQIKIKKEFRNVETNKNKGSCKRGEYSVNKNSSEQNEKGVINKDGSLNIFNCERQDFLLNKDNMNQKYPAHNSMISQISASKYKNSQKATESDKFTNNSHASVSVKSAQKVPSHMIIDYIRDKCKQHKSSSVIKSTQYNCTPIAGNEFKVNEIKRRERNEDSSVLNNTCKLVQESNLIKDNCKRDGNENSCKQKAESNKFTDSCKEDKERKSTDNLNLAVDLTYNNSQNSKLPIASQVLECLEQDNLIKRPNILDKSVKPPLFFGNKTDTNEISNYFSMLADKRPQISSVPYTPFASQDANNVDSKQTKFRPRLSVETQNESLKFSLSDVDSCSDLESCDEDNCTDKIFNSDVFMPNGNKHQTDDDDDGRCVDELFPYFSLNAVPDHEQPTSSKKNEDSNKVKNQLSSNDSSSKIGFHSYAAYPT